MGRIQVTCDWDFPLLFLLYSFVCFSHSFCLFVHSFYVGIRCISKRSFAGVGPQEPSRVFDVSTLRAGREPEGFQGVCGVRYKSPPLSHSLSQNNRNILNNQLHLFCYFYYLCDITYRCKPTQTSNSTIKKEGRKEKIRKSTIGKKRCFTRLMNQGNLQVLK